MNYSKTEWDDIKAAIALLAEGKPEMVENRLRSVDWKPIQTHHNIILDGQWLYRPKPQPKTRGWSKPDDVPGPVCWLRPNSGGLLGLQSLITAVSEGGCTVMNRDEQFVSFERPDHWGRLEYSTDRKTWLPCTVEDQP